MPGLWIDAICIDQTNIPERNQQVNRMSRIYSAAKQIWVWLGDLSLPPSIPPSKLFNFSQSTAIRPLERARVYFTKWRDEDDEMWIQTIKTICNRTYWTRLWIIQELLLAASFLILMGQGSVDRECFCSLLLESKNRRYLHPPQVSLEDVRDNHAWSLCKAWYKRTIGPPMTSSDKSSDDYPLRPQNMSLQGILFEYNQANCTDWHDKVYGLLALVTNGEQFPVDYSLPKVDLIVAVLRFLEDNDWGTKLKAALNIIHTLKIPHTDLLYNCHRKHIEEGSRWKRHIDLLQYNHHKEVDEGSLWKSLEMRIFGVIKSLTKSHVFPISGI